MPLNKLWSDHLKHRTFKLMIWGSQSLAYRTLWDGYESFLKAVIKVTAPKRNLRRKKEFEDAFVSAFDSSLFDDCWRADPVNVGRTVRNALCHAGGRVTTDFKGLGQHDFHVIEDKIQVWPTNTRALFDALKKCVFELTQRAVKLPVFLQQPQPPRKAQKK